jgi:hypothetical protein
MQSPARTGDSLGDFPGDFIGDFIYGRVNKETPFAHDGVLASAP